MAASLSICFMSRYLLSRGQSTGRNSVPKGLRRPDQALPASSLAAAVEVDHIAVRCLDDHLGQSHRVEVKTGQRLGDALAGKLGDHHLDNLHEASSLGCSLGGFIGHVEPSFAEGGVILDY